MLPIDDERVVRLTALVHDGHVEALASLLDEHPALATERHGDDQMSRTALHVATDWPGGWPRVAETVRLLAEAGAPVDGRFHGPHRETPLHWAASTDDVAALDALLDAGADIEADGAVLTGGTPLSDAVVFGQRAAARRLVERGAVMTPWQAAAVGESGEVERLLAVTAYDQRDLDNACWHACRAGELGTARLLTGRGADLEWLGWEELTTRQAGMRSGSADLVAWLVDAG